MRNQVSRRVAIVGGVRIPFCRAHTAYARSSNQDMMTAVLRALVSRSRARGAAARRRLARRRDQAFARLEPRARVDAVVGLGARDAGVRHPARVRHELVGDDPDRQQDRDRAHRRRHRGRHGQHQRRADRLSRGLPHAAARERARTHASARGSAPWLKLRPRHFKPVFPGVIEPRTHLSMGESMEITAKEWQISRAGAGRARAREPPERGEGVRGRFLRRPARRVPRREARQQRAHRHEPRAAREAQARVRQEPGRHAHGRQQHAAHRRRVRRAAVLGGVGETSGRCRSARISRTRAKPPSTSCTARGC